MRKYKKITETIEKEVLDEVSCCLCGSIAKYGKWGSSSWGSDETTVKRRKETVYPECGNAKEWFVDMCPKCFENKLIPWLRSQGADIEIEESYW